MKNQKPKNWEKELEDIVRRLIMLGYDMGREQHETPFIYTCDTDKGEKYWKEIKSLLASQKAEILGEIEKIINGKKVKYIKDNFGMAEIEKERIRMIVDATLDDLKKKLKEKLK